MLRVSTVQVKKKLNPGENSDIAFALYITFWIYVYIVK